MDHEKFSWYSSWFETNFPSQRPNLRCRLIRKTHRNADGIRPVSDEDFLNHRYSLPVDRMFGCPQVASRNTNQNPVFTPSTIFTKAKILIHLPDYFTPTPIPDGTGEACIHNIYCYVTTPAYLWDHCAKCRFCSIPNCEWWKKCSDVIRDSCSGMHVMWNTIQYMSNPAENRNKYTYPR